MWLDTDLADPRPAKQTAGNQIGAAELFLVRLWQVEVVPSDQATNGGPGNEEVHNWHGKVQHVIKGEAHTFTDWATMTRCLEAMMLRALPSSKQEEGTNIEDK